MSLLIDRVKQLNKPKYGYGSAKQQIAIESVTDNVIKLAGSKYCLILKSSSLNFELRSEDEQDVIIESYKNFINSLNFPIQYLIRTREIDLGQYIHNLTNKKQNEHNIIFKKQIDNYCSFVTKLVTTNKILTRSFYIILSLDDYKQKQSFNIIKEQLYISADIVIKGLNRLGMHITETSGIEALDLFYSFYRPNQAKTQSLRNQTINCLQEMYIRGDI